MENTRYLPAARVQADSLPLGRVSVRTRDDHEIGTLAGFVIDDHHIRSLVVEANGSQIELPMAAVQFDAAAHTLRIVQMEGVERHAFAAESVPSVTTDDLWVPFFHSAA